MYSLLFCVPGQKNVATILLSTYFGDKLLEYVLTWICIDNSKWMTEEITWFINQSKAIELYCERKLKVRLRLVYYYCC